MGEIETYYENNTRVQGGGVWNNQGEKKPL